MNGLDQTFLSVLNMSVTASYAVLAVLAIRLLLRRAPRIFSYALWSVAFFRFVCPLSFASPLSLLNLLNTPTAADTTILSYVPRDIGMMRTPAVDIGIDRLSGSVNAVLPATTETASGNPMQIITAIAGLLWAAGVVSLVIYALISYACMKRRLKTSVRTEGNVYESDRIGTALVCGFLRPRIYLPLGVSENDRIYILEHERTHIRRFDYLVKPLAFAALALHWFNPLAWLFFALLSRDMEMSCDESVLRSLGEGNRRAYSSSLLTLSCQNKRLISMAPLAFGESGVKSRIKNALHYKKPAFWVLCAAVVVVAAAVVLLASNPVARLSDAEKQAQKLLSQQTEYIGNASKVGGILAQLSLPDSLTRDGFSLATDEPPYSVTVRLRGTEDDVRLYSYSENQTPFKRSAAILFSLIGNVDSVHFTIDSGGQLLQLNVWRQEIEELLGGDVRQLHADIGQYLEFLSRLDTVLQPAPAPMPTPSAAATAASSPVSPEVAAVVEENVAIILSSPLTSSNPQDYIDAHSLEYEKIIKYGGEEGLAYMLSQFENGNAEGLRGYIYMRLCRGLLGARDNVEGPVSTPQEWYEKLNIRKEVSLPDFAYRGTDPVEQLVYATEMEKNRSDRGFTVIACKIHGVYDEGDYKKVFVTTFAQTYKLYSDTLSEESGSIIPVAITYRKAADGSYALDKYEQAKDGSYFGPSIRDFCRLPVSGKRIAGLPDLILSNYGSDSELGDLFRANLQEHLRANGKENVRLPS